MKVSSNIEEIAEILKKKEKQKVDKEQKLNEEIYILKRKLEQAECDRRHLEEANKYINQVPKHLKSESETKDFINEKIVQSFLDQDSYFEEWHSNHRHVGISSYIDENDGIRRYHIYEPSPAGEVDGYGKDLMEALAKYFVNYDHWFNNLNS